MFQPAARMKARITHKLRHSTLLAYVWRRLMFRTTVIAITGSVGKTTCRELLFNILREHAPAYQTRNNENDLWGVPGVLLRLRPWHKFAVIELAASGPGTLKQLARLVGPDVAIVTAVAHTHTNRYNSIDEIAREKSELVRNMRRRGLAILNGDDPHVRAMAELTKAPTVLFGCGSGNQVRAADIQARWPQRLNLTVLPGSHHAGCTVQTQLVGAHWKNSVLAAFAAAASLDLDAATSAGAISRVPPFRGRMQPVKLPCGATMIRDENASIDVLRAMLEVAAEARAQRRVLVLGDITDCGKVKSRRRLARAGEMVAPYFEAAVFVGKSARHAAKGAVAAGMDAARVMTAEDFAAADVLLQRTIEDLQLGDGDLIFVKGQSWQHLSRLAFAQLGDINCRVARCEIRSDCDVCPKLRAVPGTANGQA